MENANSVTNAPSITTSKKEEDWLTLSQIFQRVLLFHQCQRKSEVPIREDITITTTIIIQRIITRVAARVLWAHLPSVLSMLSLLQWFRLLASLRWLPSVALTQTSIFVQLHFPSEAKLRTSTNTTKLLISCWWTNSNFKCKCISNKWCKPLQIWKIKLVKEAPKQTVVTRRPTPTEAEALLERKPTTTAETTSPQDLQPKALSTDMRKKISLRADPITALLRKAERKGTRTNLNRRDMSPSSKNLKQLQRKKSQPRRLRMPLPNEEAHPLCRVNHLASSAKYFD